MCLRCRRCVSGLRRSLYLHYIQAHQQVLLATSIKQIQEHNRINRDAIARNENMTGDLPQLGRGPGHTGLNSDSNKPYIPHSEPNKYYWPSMAYHSRSLAISRHWPVHQLDVKNAFLHGSLSETVYMHQPPGFRDLQHPDHVCLLQRSLYGLKQASGPVVFRGFLDFAAVLGFIIVAAYSSLFITDRGQDTAYLLLYVMILF
ncbi:ribonuclease H-like domain-containing protein [Tanacetum coccineum]|uniref:Ribonuclease H-like domain-containing protein n=1 Tax=Tanacetum coccineum TaxID=301880 RepID=A0ABQ5IX23_9ASTR